MPTVDSFRKDVLFPRQQGYLTARTRLRRPALLSTASIPRFVHTNAINTESFVGYDDYDLLMVETRDAVDNLTTLGNDYRVLQPQPVNRQVTRVLLGGQLRSLENVDESVFELK